MKTKAGELSFFYAVILSLWIVTLPQLKYCLDDGGKVALEQADEKVASIEQSDFLLIKQNSNTNPGPLRGDLASYLDQLVNEYIFNHLYLSSLSSVVFSQLWAVDLSFEFIDLIFPFHYFW